VERFFSTITWCVKIFKDFYNFPIKKNSIFSKYKVRLPLMSFQEGYMQRTLVLLKPDAIQRGLVGEVTSRFERKGLKLVGMKMMSLSETVLKQHYSHIANKSFFPELSSFMKSSPVIAQCWEGKDAVKTVRNLCGLTNAREAAPGTIRGDFAMSVQCNVVHASENFEMATRELQRFFVSEDFYEYEKSEYMIAYSEDERSSVRQF